ncbi:MAG: hypothetical protein HPY66_3535 [Firmicutes bacterium]|nr:hypothetical protein [Bacillota bacterium]
MRRIKCFAFFIAYIGDIPRQGIPAKSGVSPFRFNVIKVCIQFDR